MKRDIKLFLLTFALSVLLVSLSFPRYTCAQDDDKGFDVPGTEHMLNSELWTFAKGTPYSSIESYLERAHALSGESQSNEISLPTGWKIAPAGTQVELGRFPSDAVFYNGYLVVLNSGDYWKEPQELSVVDVKEAKVTKTVKLSSIFPSACVGEDGYLYVSGGYASEVYRIGKDFSVEHTYGVNGYASGICAVDGNHVAVAYLTANDSEGKYGKGKIATLNTESGQIENEAEVGYFPYSVAYADGKIFVSVLGEDKVEIFSKGLKLAATLTVGKGPGNMTVDGNLVYVVNQNSDAVSVINAATDRVVKKIDVSIKGFHKGAAPTSCALVGKMLYVSEATTNAVSVFNRLTGEFLGCIPAGWYPTKVLVHGGNVITISAKGIHARRPNPNGPQPVKGKGGPDYVLNLLKGAASIVPVSAVESHLKSWTEFVVDGSPLYSPAEGIKIPIKHIFYIIRENRTYDQILGDLGRGNGDSSLTLFGESITPNGHRIAREFVDLDNYFADGEISVLGHSFTTSGYASPFLELLGNLAYSDRYKGYPFGTVPAVFSPSYIWNALQRKKVPFRIYGEPYYLSTAAYAVIAETFGVGSEMARKFYAQSMNLAWVTDRGKQFSDFAAKYYGDSHSPQGLSKLLLNNDFGTGISKIFAGDESLYEACRTNAKFRSRFADFLSHYAFNYYTWDLNYSDLNRFRAWDEDFKYLVRENRVPAFEYIWLPNDHTGGTNPNYPNPFQLVSENDAALGLILKTISHSPVWKNSLVLVEEDDAQNGPDHVDATRTVALAAGPYVKRDAVVHDRYDQLSMLRTVEVILGLDPLGLGDALAVPMFGIFSKTPNFEAYNPANPSSHLMDSDFQLYKTMNNGKGELR